MINVPTLFNVSNLQSNYSTKINYYPISKPMKDRIRRASKLECSAIFFLVPLISSFLSAQESEFFSASYSSAPQSEVQTGNKLGINIVDINLITPTISIGKNTKLNNIISYRSLNYNLDVGSQKNFSHPGSLNDIQYSLLIRQKLNDSWNLMVIPQVIIRSNFKNSFGSRDFFPAVAMIAMNKSKNHEGLQWGYGASYSRDFTKNTITPLFAVNYTSPKYRVDLLLPIKAQFVMTPSKLWEYGVDATFETGIYHIGSKNDFYGSYVRTINIPVGLTAAAKISGMFWVKAKIGMQFLREYDFMDSSFKTADFQEFKIKSAPYVSVGVSMRLN